MSRHKHKQRPRTLLRAKRKHALHQTHALTLHLRHVDPANPPSHAELAKLVGPLRTTLKHLRTDVLHHGSGHQRGHVAAGLKDLDSALGRLELADRAHDPKVKLEHLAHGAKSLRDAKAKAKAAGHDWSF